MTHLKRQNEPPVNTYSTRNEAIAREVVAALEAGDVAVDAYAEFDVNAIADHVLADYAAGYALKVTVDEFWTIVERHAL